MACSHDLDAEFLYPSDADVLDLYESDGALRVRFALPCPECGRALELDAGVDEVTEGDFELPLDDARYD